VHALIADDDRGTTAILAKTLQRWNVDVSIAPDGVAAWERLCSDDRRPSVALIDWMMPGLDGPELCRRIRQHPALEKMYVILLTGRDSRADMVMGLDAGADDYIVKPFDTEELRARVHVGIRVAALQERLAEQVEELQAAQAELARLAATDPLTGLSCRRKWFEMATTELHRSRRYAQPFSVLMCDLDYFKRINDTHGHSAGDDVLKQFARVLRTECRDTDLVGRLGGEEFAILLPQCRIDAAIDVGGRINESCRRIVVDAPAGPVSFTCSIGVTEVTPRDASLEDVLERADAAMYQAKRNGRDGVEISNGPMVTEARRFDPSRAVLKG
jgi:diguanylate cyclase (GGDEF)-like protein